MRSIQSPRGWLAAASLFILACSKGPNVPAPPSDDSPTSGPIPSIVGAATYEYTGFYRGEVAVRGELTLVFPTERGRVFEGNTISGTWQLEPLLSPDVLGPQLGEGTLVGQFTQSGVLMLNLHPGMADDNILLHGVFDPAGRVFEGNWSHSTFVGTRVEDRFRAVRH